MLWHQLRSFEPILPAVPYAGTGRQPVTNHGCLHGLLYVLITGIGWEYVLRDTDQKNRAIFEREGGATWDQLA